MTGILRRLAVTAALAAGVCLGMVAFAGTAQAIYFEADVPVALNFTDSNTENPDSESGVLVTVGDLFVGLGLGYENYTATWKGTMGSSDMEVGFDYVDILWAPPVPYVNVTLGAGFGTASPKGDLGDGYNTGEMSQFFFRLGLPIAKLFDVHVGYHTFYGKMTGKTIGGTTIGDAKLDGNLTTVGFRFGF